MANIPEQDMYHLRNLEESRRTQPKEVWGVSEGAWREFDRLFTQRVVETRKMFTDKNYKIERVDGIIIVGLIQYASSFLSTIKTSEKNEFTIDGKISLTPDLIFMINHCLRNDLATISYNTEDIIDFGENDKSRGIIEHRYEEIFSLITKLKQLTTD